MKTICIKPSSHSNFELYLISDAYEISYEMLVQYKKDTEIYRIWVSTETEAIIAVEERPSEKERVFTSVIPLSAREQDKMKAMTPIIAGEPTRKFKGDLDEMRAEHKEFVRRIEEHRQKMLSRDYDPSNIACINAKSTPEQLFSVCVELGIDYAQTAAFLEGNSHIPFNRIWLEKGTGDLAAYSFGENFVINEDCLIPKKAIRQATHKPVAVPKLKATPEAQRQYKRAKMMGFPLEIPKLERQETISYVEELKEMLEAAVEREDYESAAALRDAIAEYEPDKKSK